jgi:hypothetical protein
MPETRKLRAVARALRLGLLGALLVAASHLGASSLESAEPNLKAVFPLGCQSGESVEITLVGEGLEEAGALYFSRDGLSAEQIEKSRFRVSASDDAAIGDCDVWVATAEGLAGPRRFSVTACSVIAEQEGNDTADAAQQVELPSAIDARLDKPADLDWFAFEGEASQEITITCRSRSLDGSVQPAFTLFAPDRSELSHSSADRLEPQRTIQLPAAGTYRLLVHDRAYRKDDDSFYRIQLTAAPADGIPQHLGVLRPDDLFKSVSITEERGESRQDPQAIELPCRIAGRFAERGDVDWYRFAAKKDETLHIEAFGERLGQLMDLEAAIYNADDKEVAALKDSSAPKGIPATLPLGSLDPAIDWKVPADGEYSVVIRDLYGGSIFGRNRVYELIVELQRPSFYVVAMPSTSKPNRGVFIKRGGEAELSLIVVRTGGFAGPVTIRAEELAAGLTIEPIVIDGKEIEKAVKVSASNDCPAGFQTLELVAVAEIGSDNRTVPVVNAALIRSGFTRRTDDAMIYVSE